MLSSCCTTQLALWHEIVSKCHKAANPMNQHVDYIRKRFDELDAGGFTWSKESMLDIFLQLGQSENPHGSFSSVSDLSESRVFHGIEISSDQVQNVLEFPTLLPAPIDLWTEDILCKRGSHVRSLVLNLSENCSKAPGEFAYDHFYDNLIPESQTESELISPKNARELINRCPNLSGLDLYYHYEELDEDTGGTEVFLSNLIPLLSSLQQLTHLSFGSQTLISKEFPSKVVDNLPLLESLTVCISTSPDGDDSFGFNLSKLKYLSRLTLWFNGDIDETWCLYNWPRTITHLEMYNCDKLMPSAALRITHHIAPYVTNLMLRFYCKEDGTWEDDPSWNPHSPLSFPNLTHLALGSGNANLLDSFRDCISLGSLDWTYWTSEHCISLNKTLSDARWPRLKKLEINNVSEFKHKMVLITSSPTTATSELLKLNCCKHSRQAITGHVWGSGPGGER
ncbi:uncharacterized protein MELLADRAFT_108015 [Melampsora larici-populina 98AG31]|uniref:Uncharacterized protein n=1 Tax=Melampsora larici-populina (strain 98AG31 / pathotype 3-4-7) TaxID=747676 RepID=F4RRP2_MELLP|nr:uncharacterized protein MELLADRAFT_108015 [Melampsora larici-populina 98AG31]EGG04988.1 hypothetical protein MELLADRAFT_108015 [Melampsora larici-populina 98AG31]